MQDYTRYNYIIVYVKNKTFITSVITIIIVVHIYIVLQCGILNALYSIGGELEINIINILYDNISVKYSNHFRSLFTTRDPLLRKQVGS